MVSCPVVNKGLCMFLRGTIPSCQEAAVLDELGQGQYAMDDWQEPSVLIRFLENERSAIKGKILKLRASGHCMFPVLRGSDKVYILICDIEDARIGDIPVYKKGGRLFGHRIVEKKLIDGKECVLTRPDTAREMDDAPVFAEEFFGIVVQIERAGRLVAPSVARSATRAEYLLWCGIALKDRLRAVLMRLLLGLQGCPGYQSFARFVFFGFRRQEDVSFCILQEAHKGGLSYRESTKDELFALQDRTSDQEAIAFKLSWNMNEKTVAAIILSHRPRGCPFSGWWISGVRILVRHQGLGFESRLLESAVALLRDMGATAVSAAVPLSDGLWRQSLEAQGFRAVPVSNRTAEENIIVWKMDLV